MTSPFAAALAGQARRIAESHAPGCIRPGCTKPTRMLPTALGDVPICRAHFEAAFPGSDFRAKTKEQSQ